MGRYNINLLKKFIYSDISDGRDRPKFILTVTSYDWSDADNIFARKVGYHPRNAGKSMSVKISYCDSDACEEDTTWGGAKVW